MRLNPAVLFVRSSLFFLGLAVITIFFSLTGALFFSWMPTQRRGRYMIQGNRAVLTWLRLTCGVRYRIVGNLPAGPYVALAKHQSQWETYFLQWYLFPVCVVLKRELLRIPFFGWALKMMHAIAIDRGSPKAAMRQTLNEGLKRLAEGYSVLIFPEGTRTLPGEKGRYARGGAGLAIQAGVPVVPVAHNAGELWATKRFLIHPGEITVVIGEAIATDQRESRELTAQVSDWIENQVERIAPSQEPPESRGDPIGAN